MISDKLIPKLEETFPGRRLVVNNQPNPCAVFPAAHPEVGAIEIHDDGDEITLLAGKFTHGHFANYDENLSVEEKHKQIVEDVISFLRDLFADQVILWGSHSGGGGWSYKNTEPLSTKAVELSPSKVDKLYVWSGPVDNGGLTSGSTRPVERGTV
jgi:hypothetical protein